MKKSIIEKVSGYINDKVSYHLTFQEEGVRSLLEEVLKDKETLKYTLPSGLYFVSNDKLSIKIKIALSAVHVLVNGSMMIVACNNQATVKFRQMVLDTAIADVKELDEKLKSESEDFSNAIINKIKAEIGK